MFGMFGIPGFGMTEKMRKEQQAREERALQERLTKAEPWTAKTPWRRSLTLKADSWKPWSVFDVKPTQHHNINRETSPDKFVLSPNGQFLYCEKILPKHAKLALLQGSRQGTVLFDGPVLIPSLHQRTGDGSGWREEPWMSCTPSEIITQRPGLKLAHGHVVIAGLGLGWALVEVLKKRTVTKVTLVEISQELVDWVMPAIAPHIRGLGKDMDTIVGDARSVLWDFKADVLLCDIFKDYGSNGFFVNGGGKRFGGRPQNIETVWCWGAAPIADRGRGWF